ncbi:Holliday junction resolvase RuvX [Candidatus Saccharibacteria bacterium]|nr:Holliday junction resolvase RuvX [Candidatus Saccharibacteria bacterium]
MNDQDYTILGIDYGDVRVGIALAHNIAKLPHPLTTLSNNDQLITTIAQIIQEQNTKLIVLGLPLSASGNETQQTQKVRQFCSQLSEQVPWPVVLVDESYSSVAVQERHGHAVVAKEAIDAQAAAVILERYFMEQKGEAQ